MFLPPEVWDEGVNTASCILEYGLTPQYDWALDNFGGRNPKKDFRHHTNIIFSNGDLDPWHAGGVLYHVNPSGGAVSIYIEGSAHHLDLREPN